MSGASSWHTVCGGDWSQICWPHAQSMSPGGSPQSNGRGSHTWYAPFCSLPTQTSSSSSQYVQSGTQSQASAGTQKPVQHLPLPSSTTEATWPAGHSGGNFLHTTPSGLHWTFSKVQRPNRHCTAAPSRPYDEHTVWMHSMSHWTGVSPGPSGSHSQQPSASTQSLSVTHGVASAPVSPLLLPSPPLELSPLLVPPVLVPSVAVAGPLEPPLELSAPVSVWATVPLPVASPELVTAPVPVGCSPVDGSPVDGAVVVWFVVSPVLLAPPESPQPSNTRAVAPRRPHEWIEVRKIMRRGLPETPPPRPRPRSPSACRSRARGLASPPMHPTYRGLAFLLSLGSLPIACNKDDEEPTGGTKTGGPGTDGSSGGPGSTTSAPTGSGTTAGEGTGTSTGTGGQAESSTGGTDTSATEPALTGFITTNTETGSTDESGDMPPPPPENPVCQAYLEHLNECYPRYARYNAFYAAYCDMYLQYGRRDGQACVDAMEAVYACFNAIPCGMTEDDSCATETEAAFAACPTVFGGEETGGSSGGASGSSTGP